MKITICGSMAFAREMIMQPIVVEGDLDKIQL